MNYRHAFHAGNFADVLKHAMLARVLVYLLRKPGPIRYIDTHAGLGWYDLGGDEASRTGEWREGIGRLDARTMSAEAATLLQPYVDAVGTRDPDGRPFSYPGSPGLAHDLLRPIDRLLLCERHPADATTLQAAFRGDKRTKVLVDDGYTVLNAVVPPPERRGLVLIDPPFEDRAEFDKLIDGFQAGYRKWPTGSYMLWYPIKDPAQVAAFHHRFRGLGLPDWLIVELRRDVAPGEPERLAGSGLVVVNPPYLLRAEAELLLPALAIGLAGPDRAPLRWSVTAADG